MKNRETRTYQLEIRAEQNEEHGSFITGRPIVFNANTDLGYYTERIATGALDKTDLRDVRFLVNHNTDMIPLARSRNNNANSTMQMSIDENGMNIRVDLDTEGNPEAKSLYSAVKRGDVSGMSFMFTVDEDSWEGLESDHPIRTITSISKVFEVSAVTFPAYEQTSIEAASIDEALERAKSTLESAKAEQRDAEVRKEIEKLLKGDSINED